MTTDIFITELFSRIDDEMKGIPQYIQSKLSPSEIFKFREAKELI